MSGNFQNLSVLPVILVIVPLESMILATEQEALNAEAILKNAGVKTTRVLPATGRLMIIFLKVRVAPSIMLSNDGAAEKEDLTQKRSRSIAGEKTEDK